MSNVPNQNGKVLEETPAGSYSDDVKRTLRGLLYFEMTLVLCPCHFITYIRDYVNGSVG